MLKTLRLTNFRTFKSFTVDFGDGAYLVGPNNAGKSTILTGLRTADVLLRYAHARTPDRKAEDQGRWVPAYPVTLREFPSLRESIRHEFHNVEARLELTWKSGARLTAVWPPDTDEAESAAYFYLEKLPGMYINTASQARQHMPLLGVIPILTPIETSEVLLEPKYVKQNVSGRLSSRHFRNQLRILQADGQLTDFLDWAADWLGEVTIDSMRSHMGEKSMELDVYYAEPQSRILKELAWAGDGIQIWLQLLYHIHRVSASSTIILDEPEVYLHPDLQRRLVQLLESTGKQIVLATHSAELISEVDARSIALIDRNHKRARRVKAGADLQLLSDMLGTAFNVRLARALRSRVALFVEGQDMSVLRRFATTLGLPSISRERNITIIQLDGYSRWGHVEPFKWLCEELLPDAISLFVILDRDYRPESVVTNVREGFAKHQIHGHVWSRKELESYVLTPKVIARESGAPQADIEKWIDEITSELEDEVFGRLLGDRTAAERDAKNDATTIATAFKTEFTKDWKGAEYRLRVCPPKRIISGLNSRLQANKKKTISAANLARAHKADEVSMEVADLLRRIESEVTA